MAMPVPTIARIRAYSAAEAPVWSFSILMKVFTSHPSLSCAAPFRAQTSLRDGRGRSLELKGHEPFRLIDDERAHAELPPKGAQLSLWLRLC
jgi:hypothetical protein